MMAAKKKSRRLREHKGGLLIIVFLILSCTCNYSLSTSANRPELNSSLDFTTLLNNEKLSEEDTESSAIQLESTIYFNNPHLLKDQKGKGLNLSNLKSGAKSNQVNVEAIGGVYLAVEAFKIGDHLRSIANEELGITIIQSVFDSLPFVPSTLKEDEIVFEMVVRMKTKLLKYTKMLERTNSFIQEVYFAHLTSRACQTLPCCNYWDERLQYNEQVLKEDSKSIPCDIVSSNILSSSFCPGHNLTKIFQDNLKEYASIKWQYFMSMDGAFTQYPVPEDESLDNCKYLDEGRHREIYVSTMSPQTKFVMIVVDHGNSLSLKQLSIAKAVAKYVVSSLSHNDVVGLIGLSSEVSFPQIDDCLSKQMVDATLETKLNFYRFIDSLSKTKEPTNHSMGFEKAFEILKETTNHRNVSDIGSLLIVYISRGFLYSLAEARTVLETIANENQVFGDKVTINAYAVIDDSKTLMYEKMFMEDLSSQNYTKYLPTQAHRTPNQGLMLAINTTQNLSFIIGNPYTVFKLPIPNRPSFSLLHWDSLGKGLVMTISLPCFHLNKPIGVVAIDAHMMDIMEDFTFFNQALNTYAFVVDVKGFVVFHPMFIRANPMIEQPIHTHINHLETYLGFSSVWEKMQTLAKGVEMLVISQLNNTNQVKHIKYSWMKVDGSPFIICVVNENPKEDIRVLKNNEVAAMNSIAYHKLDLVPEVKKCRHLKQQATIKAATIYLAPSCFLSPFEYLNREETRGNVQGYMAYISDNTKLIANPGLKSNVRGDVASLMHIASHWKQQFHTSDLAPYIVRRYAATVRGVFQVFPGTTVEKTYNPTKRPWFSKAIMYPGKVVMTAPYLDVGGAGYIVTLSHSIYEGRLSSNNNLDKVVAVVALDLTLGYLQKLIYEAIPVCYEDKVSCFILEDNGYLLLHPDLVEPNGKGPIEQQHVTHKEPLVANDVANHKGFVRKKLCNSFSDRTVQRFYQFNSSIEGTLTNLVHGEHCAKYQIVAIPGTNIFLGIVNQTCDTVTAFCPCSMVDRLCLNCHRMEQIECECPCECPLEVDLCTGKLVDSEDLNPTCFHMPDETRIYEADPLLTDSLEPCLDISCELRSTASECIGIMGCEWCQLDLNGAASLAQPFCVEQKRCFGGVLGARTPYSDEVVGLPSEEYFSIKSTPVGPVAGGIMGCFLVLALAVYCYKHHVHRSNPHQYMSSVPDMQMRMSHLDEVDEAEAAEEQGAGHSNLVLAAFDNSINISPYRMNSGYRRPTGGDSDHGYSTMTPHDDSEHMPYVEPLLVGKDRYRPPPALSLTNSSRTSSPLPRPLSPLINQTVIPSATNNTFTTDLVKPNHMLASVQVHMVDSH